MYTITKQLLNDEDIALIETKAKEHQIMRYNVMSQIGGFYSIARISLKHGLILIYGNEHIGFNHVIARHEMPYSKNQFQGEKVHPATPFPKISIPILTYIEIADRIYDSGKLAPNSNPELFDSFEGLGLTLEQTELRFRLILYKNTKIIHTLYPLKDLSKYKPIKGFNFVKGNIEIWSDVKKGVINIIIPYYDSTHTKRYEMQIQFDQRINQKFYNVVEINVTGKKVIGYAQSSIDLFPNDITLLKLGLQYGDLDVIERQMLEVINRPK
jgi:hypothetical protein